MKIEELFSVRGKVALVTGGSRGIGEMIALPIERAAGKGPPLRRGAVYLSHRRLLQQNRHIPEVPAPLGLCRLSGEDRGGPLGQSVGNTARGDGNAEGRQR
jgi:hypothetical protein